MPQPKDKDWLNGYKNKIPIYAVYKRHTSNQGAHTDKVKGQKKIFHSNGDQNKAGVAILTSDKIHFEIKTVKRDKEGHYMVIKGSIQEEDITLMNIYAPNMTPQYIRQMLTNMKGKLTVTQKSWQTLIPHSHLWIDQLNRKLARKHKL